MSPSKALRFGEGLVRAVVFLAAAFFYLSFAAVQRPQIKIIKMATPIPTIPASIYSCPFISPPCLVHSLLVLLSV